MSAFMVINNPLLDFILGILASQTQHQRLKSAI
ncbi:uncharacterized protein METZ01_LOCUS35864 [marine metagenome]|uniref:Uncharacterized protein n=1 Tax=marine metagenome TaxID=408172 RepID=A0A381QV40_9ZZZZ